jgi:hypothetical protein
VWELEGPMPILNRSKTLIAIAAKLLRIPVRAAKAPAGGAATLKLRSAECRHHRAFVGALGV